MTDWNQLYNYKKYDYIVNIQFGFRDRYGKREALSGLNALVQRCRHVNIDIHACFIEGCDRVKYGEVLQDNCIDRISA